MVMNDSGLIAALDQAYERALNACQTGNYTDAVRILEEEVISYRHGNGMKLYADCLYRGFGIECNEQRALDWYIRAAQKGIADAQLQAGFIFKNGKTVNHDLKQAFYYYKMAAEQGNRIAQNNLGNCYMQGIGCNRDSTEGLRWLRASAEQGYVNAQHNLGFYYCSGVVCEKNDREGYKFYDMAARQGNTNAMIKAADMAMAGIGTYKNEPKAVEYYLQAAQKGQTEACVKMAECCRNGSGIDRDLNTSLKWYEKAQELGAEGLDEAVEDLKIDIEIESVKDPHEVVKRAFEYLENQEYHLAYKWLLACVNSDQLIIDEMLCTSYELAGLYFEGKGIAQNYSLALEWYSKASEIHADIRKTFRTEKGDMEIPLYALAYDMTGWIYLNGFGTAKDPKRAVEIFNLRPYVSAYHLGICYLEGIGLEKDMSKASACLRMAIDQKEEAAEQLAKIKTKLIDDDAEDAQINYLYAMYLFSVGSSFTANAYLVASANADNTDAIIKVTQQDPEKLEDYQERLVRKNRLEFFDGIARASEKDESIDQIVSIIKDPKCSLNYAFAGDFYLKQNNLNNAAFWYKQGIFNEEYECYLKLGDLYLKQLLSQKDTSKILYMFPDVIGCYKAGADHNVPTADMKASQAVDLLKIIEDLKLAKNPSMCNTEALCTIRDFFGSKSFDFNVYIDFAGKAAESEAIVSATEKVFDCVMNRHMTDLYHLCDTAKKQYNKTCQNTAQEFILKGNLALSMNDQERAFAYYNTAYTLGCDCSERLRKINKDWKEPEVNEQGMYYLLAANLSFVNQRVTIDTLKAYDMKVNYSTRQDSEYKKYLLTIGLVSACLGNRKEGKKIAARYKDAGNTRAMIEIMTQIADISGMYDTTRELADYYRDGTYVAQDHERALHYYSRISEQWKNAEAMYQAGLCCRELERQKDAEQWFARAANKKHARAAYELGVTLMNSAEFRTVDEKESTYYLESSGESGYAPALQVLGVVEYNVLKHQDDSAEMDFAFENLEFQPWYIHLRSALIMGDYQACGTLISIADENSEREQYNRMINLIAGVQRIYALSYIEYKRLKEFNEDDIFEDLQKMGYEESQQMVYQYLKNHPEQNIFGIYEAILGSRKGHQLSELERLLDSVDFNNEKMNLKDAVQLYRRIESIYNYREPEGNGGIRTEEAVKRQVLKAFQITADSGCLGACKALGHIYGTGCYAAPVDKERSYRYYLEIYDSFEDDGDDVSIHKAELKLYDTKNRELRALVHERGETIVRESLHNWAKQLYNIDHPDDEVPEDIMKKAYAYYTQAADMKDEESSVVCGKAYDPRYKCFPFMEKNSEKALNLYENAFKNGNAAAGYELGNYYLNLPGSADITRNIGYNMIEEAVDKGCNEAIIRLVECQITGLGIAPSPELAADTIRQNAKFFGNVFDYKADTAALIDRFKELYF